MDHNNKYKCEFIEIVGYKGNWYARVKLLENHKNGLIAGEVVTTSRIKSIDYETNTIKTKNSIYVVQGKI